MKIAFIGQKNICDHTGSTEEHVRHLAISMALEGHEVTVYADETDSEISRDFPGISVVAIMGIPFRQLDTILRTALATMHAMFRRYDVIHFHSIGPSVFSILPRIFRPDMRVVATFHNRDYLHHHRNRLAKILLRWAESIICHVPERTIVVSKTLAQYVTVTYKSPFTLITHGIEVTSTEETTFLKQYGLKENQYILSVSRLARHKGIHYLVKAFQALKETSELPNNWKLVIVGTKREEKEYVDYLHFLAQNDTDILFIREYQPGELLQLYSHAGVFCCLSEDDDLSYTLLEALGYGLPCVAINTTANSEVLSNCGLICKSKNILDLKQKLSSLINRPDTMSLLGKAAQERAQSEYDWQAIAKRTLAVYEELLCEKPGVGKVGFFLKNK